MVSGKSNCGFTLVELLVGILIIGVMISIAIPLFNDYRADAYNAHALHLVHDLVASEEAYFTENDVYAADVNQLADYGIE